MWIIKANGEEHLWDNAKDDDFLQFVPKHLGCKAEDIEAYWVEGVSSLEVYNKDREYTFDGKKIEWSTREIKVNSADYDNGEYLGRSDKVIKEREILGSASASKLKGWPYKYGKFSGNELE